MTGQARIRLALFSFILITLAVLSWGGVLFLRSTLSFNKSAREIAKIEARGEPITLADLAGEKIPNSENAAVVYEQAFKMISTQDAEKDFEVLRDFLRMNTETTDPTLVKQIPDIVQRYHGAIGLVKEAQKRPKCIFPIEWEKGALDVGFPHYAKIRALTTLLCTDALLASQADNMEKAVDDLVLSYKLSKTMKNESTIIGQLVQITTLNQSTLTMQRIADAAPITEVQARKLYDATSDINLYAGLIRALQGERAMGIWIYDDIRQNGPNAQAMQTGTSSAPSRLSKEEFESPQFRNNLDIDELFYLRQMGIAIDDAKKPYMLLPNRNAVDIDIPENFRISAILIPVLNQQYVARDRGVATVALARAGLTLIAYKARIGSYPETLNEAASGLGWKLDKDPFSGKQIIYKKKGNGCLIYSIGEDLKDNGGKPAPKDPRPGEQYDIVWEMKR